MKIRKIEPTIYKTKAWKDLEKALKKAPDLEVIPLDRRNKADRQNAKLMEKYINWQFKTNANGFTDKYWAYMKKQAEKFIKDSLYGNIEEYL